MITRKSSNKAKSESKSKADLLPDSDSAKDLLNNPLIQLKIVYWGPGESGKTTNWKVLKNHPRISRLNFGMSVETTDGRTLWQDSIFLRFDLNIEAGTDRYILVTQLTTATGQERFLSTREYILSGADGVVFVADSDPEMMEQNKRSFRELLNFTSALKIPYIIQLNKRDLDNSISLKDFKKGLGLPEIKLDDQGNPIVYEAIAITGEGVLKCFRDIVGLSLYECFTQK
jgi:mutual gliding-motility protein MglA